LPIAIALMIGTLFGIKIYMKRKGNQDKPETVSTEA
jgi:hypothetical protein